MDKPDVDHIEGLSPAISIDQKTTSRNPRSTVATVTEIYDYLRLLFARVGEPHCPICGRPITGQSVEQIADHILALPEGTRFLVLAPLVRGRKGEHRDVIDHIRAEGFSRVDGRRRDVRDRRRAAARQEVRPHDRGGRRPAGHAGRPAPAAHRQPGDGDGAVGRARPDRGGAARQRHRRARGSTPRSFACPEHGASLPELAPRTFSFNSPHGACPQCTGLGFTLEVDPDLVVAPERTLRRRRDPALDRPHHRLLRPAPRRHRRPARHRPGPAVAEAARAPAHPAARGPAAARAGVPGQAAQERRQLGLVRGRPAAAAAPARHVDVPGGARLGRAVHVAPPVPGVRRRPAQAGGAGRHRGGPEHLRASVSCRWRTRSPSSPAWS